MASVPAYVPPMFPGRRRPEPKKPSRPSSRTANQRSPKDEPHTVSTRLRKVSFGKLIDVGQVLAAIGQCGTTRVGSEKGSEIRIRNRRGCDGREKHRAVQDFTPEDTASLKSVNAGALSPVIGDDTTSVSTRHGADYRRPLTEPFSRLMRVIERQHARSTFGSKLA